MENQEQKQRHGFISFWLWLMIIANIISGIYSICNHNIAIWAYASAEMAQQFFYVNHSVADFYSYALIGMGCLALVNAASAILLLKWNKIGFWMIVATSAVNLCIMIAFGCKGGWTGAVLQSMAGAVLGPVILYLILHIKKEGVSCWSQLNG